MKKKLLFWIDQDFTHFGIARFMQEKHDYEMYAIYDVYERTKKFFVEQKLVTFNKIWFYRDVISKSKKKLDSDYLINFENKNKIDLWKLIYAERSFFKYNRYYHFNDNEIMSILETECKFFEEILDEVKPDVLLIKVTDWHHNHLLYEICNARGIKTLMLESTRFANRCTVLKKKIHSIDYQNFENLKYDNYLEKINNFRKQQNEFTKKMKGWMTKLRISKYEKFKAAIQFFLSTGNNNYRKTYTNYGKTRFRVLTKEIIFLLKTQYRGYFINRKLIKKINTDVPFVYFPIHLEPERTMLIEAPYFTNQIELIINIAKSLPVNYKLYVKEHPIMKVEGWRNSSIYEEIMKLPNVYLLHPSVNSEELIRNCSLVVTIAGTAAYEGLYHKKNAIVFSNEEYPSLSSFYKIKKLEELPTAIRLALKNKPNYTELCYYLDMVHKNSFDFDWMGFRIAFRYNFYFGGYLADATLPPKKIESFLEKYRKDFENAVKEHVRMIES